MKIGIVGCMGRMGRMLVSEVLDTDGCALSGGTARPEHPQIGYDIGPLIGRDPIGVALTTGAADVILDSDAIIDFTAPQATLAHAALAAQHGTVVVIGTTGLSANDESVLRAAATTTRIVYAPNMSVGVVLLTALVEQVARTLGDDYDIEIAEMHHRNKVDAPSGTALGLGRAAAVGRGVDFDAVRQSGRDGHTGVRRRGDIGFAALRGGDVVGDHTVVFAGEGERIELSHKASNRRIYARGAVRAARWAADRPNGLYSMRDVLGLG